MRFRLPILALLSLLAGAAPASALTVGISDNRPTIFADPLFAQLEAKHVRVVVSYDAMGAAEKGDNEISDRVGPYIAAAQSQGVEVMAAFEHHRGAPVNCTSSKQPQCKLPSVAKYKAEVAKFVQAYPGVKYVTAWNESNHNTQPTVNNPKRAGQYAKAAEQVCKAAGTCQVIAMDILDAANDPKAPRRKLDYSRTERFVKRLKSGYGKRASICGIHNYADVNRFRTSGTKAVTKAAKCRHYWLTETGGFYNFASFWSKPTKKVGHCSSASGCQVKALRYLFARTVKAAAHIDRAYVYTFYAGNDGRFDAGLVKGDGSTPTGVKRPAYDVVAKHI
jgi:hypothetical protein